MIELELPEPDYQDLALSFTAAQSPSLESAAVTLALAGVPDTPEPFALSMKPLADGDPVSVTRTATLGPKLSLLDTVDVELGSVGSGKSFQRTELAAATVTVTGQVTARSGGTIVRRFGRELPQPLDFTAAIQRRPGTAPIMTEIDFGE